MKVQTRRLNGETRHFYTFREALRDAEDKAVWKISFWLPPGERIRLVRHGGEFVLEQLDPEELLKDLESLKDL